MILSVWYSLSMKRKESTGEKTKRSSHRVVDLKLTQAQQKQLGEMLLTNSKSEAVYLLITDETEGEVRTATILMIPESKSDDWGFDPRSSIDVGKINA